MSALLNIPPEKRLAPAELEEAGYVLTRAPDGGWWVEGDAVAAQAIVDAHDSVEWMRGKRLDELQAALAELLGPGDIHDLLLAAFSLLFPILAPQMQPGHAAAMVEIVTSLDRTAPIRSAAVEVGGQIATATMLGELLAIDPAAVLKTKADEAGVNNAADEIAKGRAGPAVLELQAKIEALRGELGG